MRLARLVVFVALVSACARSSSSAGPPVSDVQHRLSEREGKLSRYRVAARTERGEQSELAFDFAYQAPGRMLGREYRPQSRTLSYDGKAVYELFPGKKTFRRLRVPEEAASRALKLTQRFLPFIPEGFRSPVLPWKSVTAQSVTHPRAPEAVALKAELKDDFGKPLTLTYTLRWPTLDFLVRRLESSEGVVELRADEERCEPRLGACFPLRLTEWRDGVRVSVTEVLELELFQGPAAEEFTLEAPADYASETAEL